MTADASKQVENLRESLQDGDRAAYLDALEELESNPEYAAKVLNPVLEVT